MRQTSFSISGSRQYQHSVRHRLTQRPSHRAANRINSYGITLLRTLRWSQLRLRPPLRVRQGRRDHHSSARRPRRILVSRIELVAERCPKMLKVPFPQSPSLSPLRVMCFTPTARYAEGTQQRRKERGCGPLARSKKPRASGTVRKRCRRRGGTTLPAGQARAGLAGAHVLSPVHGAGLSE